MQPLTDQLSDLIAKLDAVFLIILGVSWSISILCLYSLWRRPDGIIKKFIWTLILFVPIMGPVFYGGFYKPPAAQPNSLRAANTVERLGGPGGV